MSTCTLCIHVCDTLPHYSHRSVAKVGDPQSHHSEVWIEGADPESVSAAESVSYDAEKLALNLLSALFTLTELATGNCTQPKKDCYHLLDQKKIHGIRRMFVYSSYQLHVFFSALTALLSFQFMSTTNSRYLQQRRGPGGRQLLKTN